MKNRDIDEKKKKRTLIGRHGHEPDHTDGQKGDLDVQKEKKWKERERKKHKSLHHAPDVNAENTSIILHIQHKEREQLN